MLKKTRGPAYGHTTRIKELHREGMTYASITELLRSEGIRCSKSSIGNIVSGNFFMSVEELVAEAEELNSNYPKFEQQAEYKFAQKKQSAKTKVKGWAEPVYVFIDEIKSTSRQYPLYLFRNKRGGWCETFTPAQIDDFRVLAVEDKKKRKKERKAA